MCLIFNVIDELNKKFWTQNKCKPFVYINNFAIDYFYKLRHSMLQYFASRPNPGLSLACGLMIGFIDQTFIVAIPEHYVLLECCFKSKTSDTTCF